MLEPGFEVVRCGVDIHPERDCQISVAKVRSDFVDAQVQGAQHPAGCVVAQCVPRPHPGPVCAARPAGEQPGLMESAAFELMPVSEVAASRVGEQQACA